MNFTDFRLEQSLIDGISSIGYKEATPIQQRAIPAILDGKDLIGCAQTGTGKTAAYLLPTINRLMQRSSAHTRALVISPTRELALQIDQQVEALGYFTGISSIPVYGGNDKDGWDRQKAAIVGGVDIIIATPGRLMMHQRLGYLDLSHIETVILDEADKMLDMGFADDIVKIMSFVPAQRQTLLFSATMPSKIKDLARKILKDPEEVIFKLAKPAEGITQRVFAVFDDQKIPLLEHILQNTQIESMILFASSKSMVDKIADKLVRIGINAHAIHSDKDQEEREATLLAFRNKQFQVLVGTDVLARGIDIDGLSHVVNFDCPLDAEDYVHRIGRTARADAKGEAITFVNPKDMPRLKEIERLIEREIPKDSLPESLGAAPEWYASERSSGKYSGMGGGKPQGGGGRGGDRNGNRPERNDRNGGGRSNGGERNNNGEQRREASSRPPREPHRKPSIPVEGAELTADMPLPLEDKQIQLAIDNAENAANEVAEDGLSPEEREARRERNRKRREREKEKKRRSREAAQGTTTAPAADATPRPERQPRGEQQPNNNNRRREQQPRTEGQPREGQQREPRGERGNNPRNNNAQRRDHRQQRDNRMANNTKPATVSNEGEDKKSPWWKRLLGIK